MIGAVLEVLAFAATVLLFVIVSTAAWVGALVLVGAVRFVRCENCNHLTMVHVRSIANTCMWCRHEYVMHPLHSIHEHAPHASHRG